MKLKISGLTDMEMPGIEPGASRMRYESSIPLSQANLLSKQSFTCSNVAQSDCFAYYLTRSFPSSSPRQLSTVPYLLPVSQFSADDRLSGLPSPRTLSNTALRISDDLLRKCHAYIGYIYIYIRRQLVSNLYTICFDYTSKL